MLLISIAVILFAVMDTISKYLTRDYPVTNVLWARYLFHTLLVIAVIAPRHGTVLVRTNRFGLQAVRGLMLAGASLLFVTAIKYMPLAEATAIQFISPLLVTLLAVIFLKEKVDLSRWLAILAGFSGVLIIIRPGSGIFTWASLLPLGTAILFASYQVLTRHFAGRESPYTLIFYPGMSHAATLADSPRSPDCPAELVAPRTAGHRGNNRRFQPPDPDPGLRTGAGIAARAIQLHPADLGDSRRLCRIRQLPRRAVIGRHLPS